MAKKDIKLQTKICPVCKREFTNRKKWARRGQWSHVTYCSERCRRKAKSYKKHERN